MSNPVVLVYSHRPEVRQTIMSAIGRRPAPDVGRIDFLEAGLVADVFAAVDDDRVDLLVLDGEAQPIGGIGIARQIHLEAKRVPPIVLTARRSADRWLATWAQVDDILIHPLDPVTAAETVAGLLRRLPARLP